MNGSRKCVSSGVRRAAFAAALLMGALPSAHAADFVPTERITLVTHAGPGSGIDMFLRQVSDAWIRHKLVPVRVQVESIPGARGDRARRHVALQNRGNYHMLMGFTPQMIVGPLLTKSDVTVKSFTPVAILAVEPMVMYVHAESPWKSVKDLLDAARQKPKAILQGGGAYGAPPSIAGRDLAQEAGTEFSYTPFKSSGEAVVALLGKHVHFVLEQPSEADQHVKAGKLKPLAAVHRSEAYPGLPTFAAQGYRFRVLKQFRGVVGPPGMSAEALRYYVDVLDRTRKTPEWRQYVKQQELVEEWLAGAELASFIDTEEKTYMRINQEVVKKQ